MMYIVWILVLVHLFAGNPRALFVYTPSDGELVRMQRYNVFDWTPVHWSLLKSYMIQEVKVNWLGHNTRSVHHLLSIRAVEGDKIAAHFDNPEFAVMMIFESWVAENVPRIREIVLATRENRMSLGCACEANTFVFSYLLSKCTFFRSSEAQ